MYRVRNVVGNNNEGEMEKDNRRCDEIFTYVEDQSVYLLFWFYLSNLRMYFGDLS